MVVNFNEIVKDFYINDVHTLRNILTGWRGCITLIAPSGNAHTYLIKKPQGTEAVFPDDVRFIYIKHGKKEFYLGMAEGLNFRLTQHSRFQKDSDAAKGAMYLYKIATSGACLPNLAMKMIHNGRCAKCGRLLTDDTSMKLGFGPKCRKKLGITDVGR